MPTDPLLSDLAQLYARDLAKLIGELELYPEEAGLWAALPGVVNPAGNLALHLIGNLSTFVGLNLGGIPFERDRPAEFARKGVPRAELLAGLRATDDAIRRTLAGLDAAALARPYPVTLAGFPEGMSTGYLLLHLYGHLNWHLGQINYLRRLLYGQS